MPQRLANPQTNHALAQPPWEWKEASNEDGSRLASSSLSSKPSLMLKLQPPTHHSCASNRVPREPQRVQRVLTSYNWECKFVAARQPAEFLGMGTLA